MSNNAEIPRLKKKYREQIAPVLRGESKYVNVMQIPGLTEIVANMGVSEAARDSKIIDGTACGLTVITGQKPAITRARKSIARFKLREGMPIGCHITPRGNRMWEFAGRLPTLTLPRVRDFYGLDGRRFGGKGDYTLGLNEQVMFLEIGQDKIDRIRGMNITFVTSATNNQEGRALLKHLGSPFKAVDGPEPVEGGRGPASQLRKKE